MKGKETETSIKPVLISLVVLVVLGMLFLWMAGMDYFVVSEVTITTDKGVVPDTMRALCDTYLGRNILRCTTKSMTGEIMALGYVSSVNVVKMHPNTIVVDAVLNDYAIRVSSEGDGRLFLAGENLVEVSRETWNIFAYIPEVKLTNSYASMLYTWGIDNGFRQMVNLVVALYGDNLITNIKYDINDTGYFGRLVLTLDSINATVSVNEPVEPQRLIQALGIVKSRQSESGNTVRYELTSTSLSW